jgi:zinc protease
VTRFRREPVGQGELLKARRQIEKSLYNSLETVEGQASELGYYEVLGDYRLAGKHREAIRQVTPAQIMDVANKYLKLENCSMVSYLPESGGVADPEPDEVRSKLASYFRPSSSKKATAPGAAAAETAAISKPIRASKQDTPVTTLSTLDNGLRVIVRSRPTVPMVSMLTLLQGGTRLEPVGKSGLSMLATRTFVKGTTSYSAEDIVGKVEGLGGAIESFSSFDVTGAYVNILSEHLDKAVDIYKEVLREPKFAGETVEKEKSKLLKELAKRHDHPVYVSIDNLFKKVFGNHPYAHPFLGDKDEVQALSAGDCASWYGRALVPQNMVMAFVGDIAEERALEIAQGLVGDLAKAPLPEPEVVVPTEPMEAGLHTLTRESLKQAVGLVGFMAPPMMTDESISLGVLNGVMTGLGGRLFVELRDKRSLGYMAGSTFMPMKDKSIFYGYTNPGPENVDEAIEVILAELDKVATEPVTDYELNRSKQWLIGSQTMKLQRNLAQAIEYGIYESLGYGYDIVERASALIERVTAEDIQKAAAGVFQRDKGVFVKLVPDG